MCVIYIQMDQQPVRDLTDVLGRAEPNFRSEGNVTTNNMKGIKRRRFGK